MTTATGSRGCGGGGGGDAAAAAVAAAAGGGVVLDTLEEGKRTVIGKISYDLRQLFFFLNEEHLVM